MIIEPIGTILLPNWITVSGYTFGTIDHPSLVRLTDTAITVTGNINLTGYADLSDIADPGFPAANKSRLFSNIGHTISISESDVWHDLSMGGLGTSSCIHDPITITDQGGLNITWSAGIVFDAVITGGNQLVSIAAQPANQACTANSLNYLFFDHSGGVLVLNTTGPDYSDGDFSIAHIFTTHNAIFHIKYRPIDKEVVHNIKWALREAFPSVVVSGLLISAHAAGGAFDVDQSAGSFVYGGFTLITAALIDSTVTNIRRWFHNVGDNWESDVNSQIDAANWDDDDDGAGVIPTSPAKYYRSVFVTCGDCIHWVYPQVEYANLNAALVGPNPTLPPVLEKLPKTVALIMKHGDVAFPAAGSNQWIDVRPMLTGGAATTLISDHGNLAGLGDDDHSQYLLTDGTRKVEGTLFLKERAGAIAHVATYGQIWVKTAVPCELWFTDDTGVHIQLGVGKVKIDADAAAGYIGAAAGDGVLRTSAPLIYTDGGDFVTISLDAGLTNLATVAMAADKFYYTSADNTHVAATVTAFARSILDDADEATFKATVNLVIGTDVQIQSAVLDDLHALGPNAADSDFLVGTAAGTLAWETGGTARTSIGLGTGNSPTFAGASFINASDHTQLFIDRPAGSFGLIWLQTAGSHRWRIGVDDTAEGGANAGSNFAIHNRADDGSDLGSALAITRSSKLVTFAGNIIAANYTAANLLTACATNAGTLDFSAASKTLTVENNAIVSQDYSSDASPTFGGIVIADNGTIGQAAGPLLTFDDSNNHLHISGCYVGIGGNHTPGQAIDARSTSNILGDARYNMFLFDNTAMDAGVGAGIIFGGRYTAAGAQTSFAAIWGEKENANDADFAAQLHLGTRVAAGSVSSDLIINSLGNVGMGIVPVTKLTVEGTITLKEQAAADGDTPAYGQIWVKTATPNELWFTDDAGTDHQIAFV